MLECHEDGQQLIVLDRIHANVIFLVGSLLYMPVSIWDVIVERRKQDLALESSENAYYFMDDDASSNLELQAQQQEHWLYLLTLLLATLAYLLNGLLETKMSLDDYQREMERLLQLPPSSSPPSSPPSSPSQQQLQLQELPLQQGPPSPSPLLQNDSDGQPDKRVLLLPYLHFQLHPHHLHSPPVEISPRFKHDIINGGLFCVAAALEFAFSIVGRSKVLLSLSAHCYVANALLTIWLRRQDDFHPTRENPSILFVHAGDWLFLVGATLDATGTWLELLGYLKEPAGLWLLSSVAWLTDSLLYLAADLMNLREEEAQEEQQQDHGGGGLGGVNDGDVDNIRDEKNTNHPSHYHHHHQESTNEMVEFRSNRVPIGDNRHDDTTSHYQLQQENEDDQTMNVTTVLAVDTNNNYNNNKIIKPPLPALMDRTDFDSDNLVTPYVAADDVNLV